MGLQRIGEQSLGDPDFDFDAALPNLPFESHDVRAHLRETLRRLREL